MRTEEKNKPEIPPSFLETKERDRNTAMFAFHNELTLLSYLPDNKKKKIVIALSTTHDLPDKTNDVKIPDIINFYNKNKGGVDVFDRMCKNYTVSRITRRWPICFSYGLLNMGGIPKCL